MSPGIARAYGAATKDNKIEVEEHLDKLEKGKFEPNYKIIVLEFRVRKESGGRLLVVIGIWSFQDRMRLEDSGRVCEVGY